MKRSETAVQRIRDVFPDAVDDASAFHGDVSVTIRKDRLSGVVRLLKEEPDLGFDYLSDLAGVDYLGKEPRFEVVCHLTSTKDGTVIRLKIPVTSADPTIHSITPEYPSANWYEREIYDMFGITFPGHPDMRRILMPEGWRGHPLRKDYPLGGEAVAFTSNKDSIEEQSLPFILEGKRDGY